MDITDSASPMTRSASISDLERHRALLWQVVEDVYDDLPLESLLGRIVERARILLGADDGAIGLYDPELDCVCTAASSNIREEQLTDVLPRGHGLMGRVLELDEAVHCRYGDLPHPTRAEAADMDMLGMPIRLRGELIGVFTIGAFPPIKFTALAEEFLAHVSRHAAFAIDNARRHVLEQRRTARFSLVVRVAGIISSSPDIDTMLQRAADVVHELLGYPNSHIAQIDPSEPGTLVIRVRGGNHKRLGPREDRQSIDCGIMGAAVRQRRTQMVNDVTNDPRYVTPPGAAQESAELAIPIMSGDEVLGVLNVESQHPFDDLDRQSLEVVAEHLALAIQGSRLFDQSRQLAVLEERQHLARDLHDNVTQILSSISLISQSLGEAWETNPEEGARRTRRLGQLAQMAFSELREMLGELSPVVATGYGSGEPPNQDAVGIVQLDQQGLMAAAERVVSTMLPPHIACRMDFVAYRPQILEHEKALLRICQEATSNAIRHALASELEISAGTADDHVWLRISDDGQGFSTSSVPGRGISNIGHRILALGGAFHVAARLPSGTCLEVRLPCQDRGP